jgi:glycosyltransferase involved in cell wall biosynthesis
MALVDVLIPTCRRKTGLAVVLASLFNQTHTDFNIIISDQTEESQGYLESDEIGTLIGALRWRGHQVTTHHHLP